MNLPNVKPLSPPWVELPVHRVTVLMHNLTIKELFSGCQTLQCRFPILIPAPVRATKDELIKLLAGRIVAFLEPLAVRDDHYLRELGRIVKFGLSYNDRWTYVQELVQFVLGDGVATQLVMGWAIWFPMDDRKNTLYPEGMPMTIHYQGFNEVSVIIKDMDVEAVRAQESTGLEEHPSVVFAEQPDEHTGPFIEKYGVYDPEAYLETGRAFTADALRRLFPDATEKLPDVSIFRSKEAIREYNNPALFSGMFPTLFPWGTLVEAGIGAPAPLDLL
ncbi:hypothetical protein V5O48_012005 [Marasmius crinis-equi]|uniref:Uncharacterized protein n=1 Tax=Marasmius crinis-equi TaxID=585013 RepID=A0ABR3F3Z4_9AGAR